MDSRINRAYSRKFDIKTLKSWNNILMGHKSQQTYFDALLQDLLPFYHLVGEVPQIDNVQRVQQDDLLYPYFYDASRMTFQALRLLTQSLSNVRHQTKFTPVTNHLYIQSEVKVVYKYFKEQVPVFERLLIELFEQVHKRFNCCLSYLLLPNYLGLSYTEDDLANHFNMPLDAVHNQLLNEYNYITHLIAHHEILSIIYIRIPLHKRTMQTYQLLNQGYTIEQMAHIRQVRTHTIDDHLVEILIKDYPIDWSVFVSDKEVHQIKEVYESMKVTRLKQIYEQSPVKDYLKIKLALCVIKKDALL